MISKTDLKDKGSDYYTDRLLRYPTTEYVVLFDDVHDPGKIMFKIGYPFKAWSVVLKINGIVDPFSLEVGQKIRIPNRKDLQEI